jgi:flagellar hook-associated protein 1 FlgK
LEKRLKELLGVNIFRTSTTSIDAQGTPTVDYSQNHTITLGGMTLVDNSTYHELSVVEDKGNYKIVITNQDHTTTDITNYITEGEIGALYDIRGREIDDNTLPTDGTLGDLISSLDALSQGLIRSVNSIYSYSAQPSVNTDPLVDTISITPEIAKVPLSLLSNQLYNPVKDGTLKLQAYDDNGNPTQEIKIDIKTSDSIDDVIDKINNALTNAGIEDTKAKIVNGQIKFIKVKNGVETNKESPNILVKDDGSLLFSALNEIEYMPLDKINTTRLPIPLENGSFDIVVYNNDGDEIARRTITIDFDSQDPKYSTIDGIISQINTPNIDDNQDNNIGNDVDDYYEATFINGRLILTPKSDENTYIGLDNDSANFGGAIGVNKFFDGDDASTIKLRDELAQDPSLIHAYKAPNEGNNEVANAILELQFEEITFYKNSQPITNTIYGFYKDTTSALANQADIVSNQKDATQTLLTNISNQYYSLSGVNIDEELINLEMYQRGYQANTKVITTINQMLDALMAIKQ